MNTRSTIKDVALVAGVHFATVSKSLRGIGCIPAATRDRIRLAADRLGYMRNPAFHALSQRRAHSTSLRPPKIAIISNRSPEEGFFRLFPHYRLLCQGVQQHATELGYDCELLFLDQGHHNSKTLRRHLKRAGIRGLILAALEPSRRALDLPWEEFCVVKIDSGQMQPAFTFVSVDQLHYTRLAFQKMRALGYRRIGLATGIEDEKATGDLHTAAYLLEQAAIPEAERVEPFYFEVGWRTPQARKALIPWSRREQVDAVISNWMQIRQLVRPFHIKQKPVACATMCMTTHVRGLAGIVGDLQLVGRRAIALLAGLIQTGQYGIPAAASYTYVKGIWHDGDSAPPRDPNVFQNSSTRSKPA